MHGALPRRRSTRRKKSEGWQRRAGLAASYEPLHGLGTEGALALIVVGLITRANHPDPHGFTFAPVATDGMKGLAIAGSF